MFLTLCKGDTYTMSDQFLMSLRGRSELISVPIDSRPRASEIRPYLKSLQAYSLKMADEAFDVAQAHPNSMSIASRDVQRLITALATDLEYIRIPVIWSIWQSLCKIYDDPESGLPDAGRAAVGDLNTSLGILLSHFDLSEHLTEASKRIKAGETGVDQAFFIELEQDLEKFENNRQVIFADSMERSQRITAVFDLPSGIIPKLTYFTVKFFTKVNKYNIVSFFDFSIVAATIYVFISVGFSSYDIDLIKYIKNAVEGLSND